MARTTMTKNPNTKPKKKALSSEELAHAGRSIEEKSGM